MLPVVVDCARYVGTTLSSQLCCESKIALKKKKKSKLIKSKNKPDSITYFFITPD